MKALWHILATLLMTISVVTAAAAASVDYEYLDARVRELMKRDDMMGLAIAVVEKGEIRFARGYGQTEAGGRSVDENTSFRWASVSKGLSGSLAAQLDYEGKLSLESPVADWKTSLRLPGTGESVATVKDVLSHRLGLIPNAYDNKIEGGVDPVKVRADLAGLKPVCQIGDCHGYQNVAFDAISEILEKSTGQDFETLTRSRVFEPLGMTTARVTYNGFISSENYARPYSWSVKNKSLFRSTVTLPYFRVATAGGVSSSILDMARYMQAQMGLKPAVFHPEALKKAHQPLVVTHREARGMGGRFEGLESAEYALGWRIYSYHGRRLIGHRGMVRGTRALILFDPVEKSGIAMTWNSNVTRPTGLQFEVMDMVYGLPKRDWMRLLNEDGKT